MSEIRVDSQIQWMYSEVLARLLGIASFATLVAIAGQVCLIAFLPEDFSSPVEGIGGMALLIAIFGGALLLLIFQIGLWLLMLLFAMREPALKKNRLFWIALQFVGLSLGSAIVFFMKYRPLYKDRFHSSRTAS